MNGFPGAPRLLKGGIVPIDQDTSTGLRIIMLQSNADTLTRTLAPESLNETGNRSEALRLTEPPVETIELHGEIDLEVPFEFPSQIRKSIGSEIPILPVSPILSDRGVPVIFLGEVS